jgi:hypothetical protein
MTFLAEQKGEKTITDVARQALEQQTTLARALMTMHQYLSPLSIVHPTPATNLVNAALAARADIVLVQRADTYAG